jgi:tRNA-dihydrouridine synthase B
MKNNFWKKQKKPILALAPMAGVSDSAFRQLCKRFGADVLYTEMVSADALHYDSKKTLELLKFKKSEKPIICQLFGKRIEMFSKAVKMVEKAGFDGIDLNFGCPAKKVVAHGGGVTLMRDLRHCRQLVLEVIKNTKLPVSVKIRAGIDNVTALDFLEAIEGLPVPAIMIHGRYFKNAFSGSIDYEMIRKVKERFRGIVLANGGINTPYDAKKMLDLTGVDGLGLARGLYGKPWLFKQIKDYLRKGKYKEFELKDIKKTALKHAKLAEAMKGKWGIVETRKHLAYYVKGLPNVTELRNKLVRVENIKEIRKILD